VAIKVALPVARRPVRSESRSRQEGVLGVGVGPGCGGSPPSGPHRLGRARRSECVCRGDNHRGSRWAGRWPADLCDFSKDADGTRLVRDRTYVDYAWVAAPADSAQETAWGPDGGW